MGKTILLISPEVREVLEKCTFEGFNLYLPAGLSRELYTQVDKVLRLAGACWDRKQPMGPSGIKGAHVITSPEDAQKLGLAIEKGQITDTKKLHQQFFTPVAVAEMLVNETLERLEQDGAFQEGAAMNTLPPMRFMDPSCGDGRFLDAMTQWLSGGQGPAGLPAWATVVGVEIDEQIWRKAIEKGHLVMRTDFLSLKPKGTSLCDYIFMNPPFTAGQDMQHVMHAFSFLKPGGTLRAITSANAGEGTSNLHQQFKAFCDVWAWDSEYLASGTFKESGTNVATKVWTFIHPDF